MRIQKLKFQAFGNILFIFHGFPEMFPGPFSDTLDSTTTPLAVGKIPRKTGYFLLVYILASSENMVGDNFENFLPEVTKMHLKSSTMVGENLKNTYMEWLKGLKFNRQTALKKIPFH